MATSNRRVQKALEQLCILLAIVGACADRTPGSPVLESISPSSAPSNVVTEITVSGRDFYQQVGASFDNTSLGEFDTLFVVTLRGESSTRELGHVRWIDPRNLSAEAPTDLALGTYDLVVIGPRGTSNTLSNAFTVCADGDGDGRCECTDADADGFGQAGTDQSGCANVGDDCDDTLATRFPGAPELADDGVDQDCNGSDTVTCILDSDMDGFGNAQGTTTLAPDGRCDTSDSEALTATDCDDNANSTFPGAAPNDGDACMSDQDGDDFGDATPAQGVVAGSDCDDTIASCTTNCTNADGDGLALCAGDCDDSVASGASCTAGCTQFYADTDSDGFGDLDAPAIAVTCVAPTNHVANSTDCDDAVTSCTTDCTNADADSLARCAGDCDDTAATGATCTTGCTQFFSDTDSDGFGDLGNPATSVSCVAPTAHVSDSTDCNDGVSSIFPGATEVVADGIDQNCNGGDSCYDDSDNDGFVENGSDEVLSADLDCLDLGEHTATTTADCDDTSLSTFPGAAPNDGADCMKDADGDGFGDDAPPLGVIAGTDCADQTPADLVCGGMDGNFCNSGAVEGPIGDPTCSDGADNDCDGDTDLADPACGEFSHGGWNDVVALGPKRNASGLYVLASGATSGDVADSDKRITIAWNAFGGSNSGREDGYRVFRSTIAGGQDFGAPPLFEINDPAIRSLTDTTGSPGTVYYYVVRPTVGAVNFLTTESYTEIRVVSPPDNMALVHRWIANAEVCGLMPAANSATIDPSNDYRCDFTGRGSTTGGHFDLGHELLVDRFELGCDTAESTVTYIASASRCEESGVEAHAATPAALGIMTRSSALLPPLTQIGQLQSRIACNQQDITIADNGGSTTIAKRLLTQKEWSASAAWSPALSDPQIDDLESGSAIAGSGDCNTNDAHDGTEEATADRTGIGANAFRTGSVVATIACQSRYGVQDMVGNVYEWTSGQCSWTDGICSATGSIEATDMEMDGFTNSLFFAQLSSAPFFSPALGIPLNAVEDGALTPAAFGIPGFHSDVWFAIPSAIRGLMAGGYFTSGNSRGRWNKSWTLDPAAQQNFTGVRCAIPYP